MTQDLPQEIWLIIFSYLPFEHLLKVNDSLAEKKYVPNYYMIIDLVQKQNKDAILWLLRRGIGVSHHILNAGFAYTNLTIKFWEKIQKKNTEAPVVSKMMDVCVRDKNLKILQELYETYASTSFNFSLIVKPMPSIDCFHSKPELSFIKFVHDNYFNCYCLDKKIVLNALYYNDKNIFLFILNNHDKVDCYGYNLKHSRYIQLYRLIHDFGLDQKLINYTLV